MNRIDRIAHLRLRPSPAYKLALAAPLVLAFAVAGEEPGEAPPLATFGEVVDVRVVNLEVVVTDRQGSRVAALERDDFRLEVGGRPVAIEFFTEVRDGRAGAGPALGEGDPGASSPRPVGTSFLVYVDDLFTLKSRRDVVLRDLKADVAALGPADRMAIVAYDGRRLVRLADWTGSPAVLGRALDQALARPSHGIRERAELARMSTSRRMTTISGYGSHIDQLVFARQIHDRVERSVMAVASVLRAHAQAPGRKVLLLLAGNWPQSPMAYATNSWGPVYDRRLPRTGDLYRPLVDTANRLGYTLYPVDVHGLEARGPDVSSAAPGDTSFDFREDEVHATLLSLAQATGGKALINSGRRSALAGVLTDTRSYYSLGFTPTWRRNDRRLPVEVTVLRPGLAARARDSVLDLSQAAEVSMMVEHSLLFGGAPGAPAMTVALAKPQRAGRHEMEVPVSLTVPLSSLTALLAGGGWAAHLELRVAAMDERGDRSDIPVIRLVLPFDRRPPATGHIVYDTRLRLRRIEQHLILTLFDPASGTITSAEADVRP